MTNNRELVALAEPEWCDKCRADVIPMRLGEYLWSRVCWHLVMHWPYRFFMSRAHAAILPWAGNIAFRCTCWSALRSKATTPTSGDAP